MYRIIKIFLVSLTSLLVFLMPLSNCSSLSNGDFHIYEIVNAGYYVEYGSNKIILDSYRFGSLKCPIGTKVNATVEDAEPFGNVKFGFWVSNRSNVAYFTGEGLI